MVEPSAIPKPGKVKKASHKGESNPEQDLSAVMQSTKNVDQAMVTEARDMQTGYREVATTIKLMGDAFGYTQKNVTELGNAYNGEINAEHRMIAAAKKEQGDMLAMLGKARQLVKDTSHKKSDGQKHNAAIREEGLAESAYLKSRGAVFMYTQELKLLAAEKEKAVGKAQLEVDLTGVGKKWLPDVSHTNAKLSVGFAVPTDHSLRTVKVY